MSICLCLFLCSSPCVYIHICFSCLCVPCPLKHTSTISYYNLVWALHTSAIFTTTTMSCVPDNNPTVPTDPHPHRQLQPSSLPQHNLISSSHNTPISPDTSSSSCPIKDTSRAPLSVSSPSTSPTQYVANTTHTSHNTKLVITSTLKHFNETDSSVVYVDPALPHVTHPRLLTTQPTSATPTGTGKPVEASLARRPECAVTFNNKDGGDGESEIDRDEKELLSDLDVVVVVAKQGNDVTLNHEGSGTERMVCGGVGLAVCVGTEEEVGSVGESKAQAKSLTDSTNNWLGSGGCGMTSHKDERMTEREDGEGEDECEERERDCISDKTRRDRKHNVRLMMAFTITSTLFFSVCQWNVFDAYLAFLAKDKGFAYSNSWVGFAGAGGWGFTIQCVCVCVCGNVVQCCCVRVCGARLLFIFVL
eukprot:GHVQ01003095.1.p1 GENE.GHVQ01003095.1~~GHVQ01003095.1.p1  ORF type:complete len:419 (+),score=80.83 GHVQ01003095.1:317-1573(+)